jgi:RNA 2',3'-cyclic 3'-phosphodiesterase
MAGGRLRLFLALDLPEGHRRRAGDVAEELRGRGWDARWVAPDNHHVTLRFLGATEEAAVPALRDALAPVARSSPSLQLALRGLGAFPTPRRARVLWAGVHDPSGTLPLLAAAMERALEPLGWKPEGRPYTAHLTLARLRAARSVEPLPPDPFEGLEPFSVAEVVLYRSRLHPSGARYTRIDGFPLGERSPPARGCAP